MALDKGTALDATRTAFDILVKEEYDYEMGKDVATARDGVVYNQTSTDRDAVITQQRAGSGYLQEKQEKEDVDQGTVQIGDELVFVVGEYAKSIPISRTFYNDDFQGVTTRTIKDEARLLRITQDKNATAVYSGGFDTTAVNDGSYWFADDHTTLNGVTVDNKETGVFNGTNLETAFVSLKRQKAQDGTLGYHEPSFVLVPTNLHKEAMEVTASELKPNSANNDMNYYSQIYPGLMVKSSPFLDDTSTTAWFLGSRNHNCQRWVRESYYSTMVDWQYQANNDYVYKFGYREIVGAESYAGIVGSDGSV